MKLQRLPILFSAFALQAAVGCASSAGSSWGSKVIPAEPALGAWPEVGAAVLDDEATLTYKLATVRGQERLIAVVQHRRRIKILSESGTSWARVELPIDEFSTVANVWGRSVGPAGRSAELDDADLRTIAWRGPRQLAAPLKLLVFEVPRSQVGGIIEYGYDRIYADADFVPPWPLGGRLPRVRSELSIVVPDGMRIEFRTGDGELLTDERPLRREAEGAQRLVFVKRDIKPYYIEPRMVHSLRLVPWVASVVVEATVGGEKRRLQTWEAVRQKVAAMMLEVGASKGQGTPEERYIEVRDQLNGLDVPSIGALLPRNADALLSGKAACTRDAAGMLSQRMKDGELPNFPALIASDAGPPLIEGMPSLFPFTRGVVAVDVTARVAADASCREDPINQGLLCTIPDQSYAFLDPLCSTCQFGEIPTAYTGGRALVFREGRAEWVDVPLDPPQRNRKVTQWRYRLSIEGELKGGMSGEFAGSPARQIRRELWNVKNPDSKPLSEVLLGKVDSAPPLQLSKTQYSHLVSVERPLGVTTNAKLPAEKLGYERFRLSPKHFASPSLPGRWRMSRRSPALLEAPSWVETVARIELPVGYEVELPDVVQIVTDQIEYAAGWKLEDRTLTYSRRVLVKVRRVEPPEWDRFRQILSQIDDLETSGIVTGFTEQ